MKQYDYLIVGSGLYGAVFAQQAVAKGKKVLVIDKRPNIAGNVYTEDMEKIHVHKYGAHIFHTNNKEVWNYITKFAEFNRFTNSPVANYKGELYSLPFNMYTFNKMWGVITPQEAADKIKQQKKEAGITEPKNLEEHAALGHHALSRRQQLLLYHPLLRRSRDGRAACHVRDRLHRGRRGRRDGDGYNALQLELQRALQRRTLQVGPLPSERCRVRDGRHETRLPADGLPPRERRGRRLVGE